MAALTAMQSKDTQTSVIYYFNLFSNDEENMRGRGSLELHFKLNGKFLYEMDGRVFHN